MSDKYILDDNRQVVPCDDLMEWATWFEKQPARHVGNDQIGDARISTVFLGLDYSLGRGVPVLWETMIFGGVLDGEMDRCSGAWKDAEAMHKRMVERVKNST